MMETIQFIIYVLVCIEYQYENVKRISNFIEGTHLWNTQESSFVYDTNKATGKKEISHDVLYREGENQSREVTFTPRLIAFDLKVGIC